MRAWVTLSLICVSLAHHATGLSVCWCVRVRVHVRAAHTVLLLAVILDYISIAVMLVLFIGWPPH